MKVVDLTRGYITHVINEDNFFAYENLYPALFEHYYRYWTPRKPHESVHRETDILRRRDLVIASLKKVYPKIKQFEPKANELKVILFVGDHTSNGHAFYDDGSVVVWLPVECYDKEFDADVFITHEIIHGLHYMLQPDFYFMDEPTKYLCSRQLLTEGLATYMSSQVLQISEDIALWGEYLSEKDRERWMSSCAQLEQDLFGYAIERYDDPLTNGELFVLTDKNGLVTSRGGYYIGLRLIKSYISANNLSTNQLLDIPFATLQDKAKELLISLSNHS